MRTALVLLFAAGCGFHSVGNGDGSTGDDLGVPADLAGSADLYGVPPGSDLSGGGGGACAQPTLLVGVEDVSNSGSGGGRVARMSVAGGVASQCATLSGQGLIGSQPMAVAASGNLVAAATFDGLYVVDASTDTVKFSKPNPDGVNNLGPFDAFTLKNPSGTLYFAVAWGRDLGISGAGISEVEAYDANGSAAAGSPWCPSGSAACTAVPLSLGIYSMAAHPGMPSHFLALDGSNDYAALEVDPWAAPPTATHYVGMFAEPLGSIYSVSTGATRRLAWLDTNMSNGAIQWSVDDGTTTPPLNGPFKCTSSCTTMLHVVPDPTTSNGYFVLCDGATVSTRTVVHADDSGACSVVLDGTQFGAQSRLSRLGISQ